MATLAEKIAAAKAALVQKRDALQALKTKMEQTSGDVVEADEADTLMVDELDQDVDKLLKNIALMEKTESALARGARPAGEGGSGQIIVPAQRQLVAPGIATGGHLQRKADISLFVRSAIAAFEAHETHYPVAEIIERRWPDHQDLLEVSKLVTGVRKGTQNPAMTNVPEWAGALVRETFAAFMDLLQPESVIPRLGLAPLDFNGASVIKVPMRLPTAAGGNNLSGAFRKEGFPIRIDAARMGTQSLKAYGMGVIGTFTMEMLEASPINFEQAVQRWMIEDTAATLDTAFLDDTAEVADTRPAGIQNGLAAEDTAASSGSDPAQIQADLLARVTAMTGAGLGRRPVWLMNPTNAAILSGAWNSVGNPAFPSMNEATPKLMGYPVVTSITVPADLVFLIDAAELAFAGGAPRFSYSDQAAIVEQDGLPLTNGVQAAVQTLDAGVPARSLWQTYSGGIRALWTVSWARMREHSVQVITDVAWGPTAP